MNRKCLDKYIPAAHTFRFQTLLRKKFTKTKCYQKMRKDSRESINENKINLSENANTITRHNIDFSCHFYLALGDLVA